LEAEIVVRLDNQADIDLLNSVDLAEICIVSNATIDQVPLSSGVSSVGVEVTSYKKCGRCWRLLPEVAEDGDLCDRCEGVVNG
jgi:isoleucyl-tRNA synthetase